MHCKMKSWVFWALLALVVLGSCSHRVKVPTPDPLLTEQEMIDVLADSYLIEAELNQLKVVGKDNTALQKAYYDQLFEHYGITDSIFSQNLRYYTYQLPVLERIMDSVNNRFERMQK